MFIMTLIILLWSATFDASLWCIVVMESNSRLMVVIYM